MEPVVDLVDGFSDDAAFDFEVTVFLKPAWELTSYDPVVLPLPDFEVTEEQVERNVQAIVEDRAKYVEDAEARQVDEHTQKRRLLGHEEVRHARAGAHGGFHRVPPG